MTPAQDAHALVEMAWLFRIWRSNVRRESTCLRGALRIIIAHGSRKVREEAKELLKKVTYD